MRARAFNPQVFLEILCCGGFGALMLYLALSGRYLSYVTPRMEPYLYFAGVVMLIWAFTGLLRLFRPQHVIRSAHCFVLVIPILLMLLPHKPLGAEDISGKYTGAPAYSGTARPSAVPDSTASPEITSSAAPAASPLKTPSEADTASAADEQAIMPKDETSLPGLDQSKKTITVSDRDFGMWMSEIYMNTETYEGYTVTLTGFVFKDSDMLQPDEFVPARLMMTCCAADLSVTGILCKYDEAARLEEKAWVTVEGTLSIGSYEYDGEVYDEPQIAVTKITPAGEVDGYVYPY